MQRLINCRQPRKTSKGFGQVAPYLFHHDKVTWEAPSPVHCKVKQKHSRAKIVVVLLVLGVNLLGMSVITETVAYFNDTETSGGNLLAAALLDFELDSTGDFSPKVSPSHPASRLVSVEDIQSILFHYQVRAENFAGPLCDVLHFKAMLQGDTKYEGPLVSFEAGEFGFGDPDDWGFFASLASLGEEFAGKQCEFDLVYSGWQLPFPLLFSGFHDEERIPSVIIAKEKRHDDEEEDDEDKDDKEDKEDKEDKGEKGDKGDKGPKPEDDEEEEDYKAETEVEGGGTEEEGHTDENDQGDETAPEPLIEAEPTSTIGDEPPAPTVPSEPEPAVEPLAEETVVEEPAENTEPPVDEHVEEVVPVEVVEEPVDIF